MKGFILAAGFGRRMKDLTADKPKPLLPIKNIPLIYYSLFLLYLWEAESVVINLHYYGEMIERELKSFPFFEIIFSKEESILGTAGGLRKAVHHFGMDPVFVLLNPDTLILPGAEDEPARHLQSLEGADSLLFLSQRPEGSVETGFDFQSGSLSKIISRSDGAYYYCGYSLVSTDFVRSFARDEFLELGPFWKSSAESGRLLGQPLKGTATDAGALDSYLALRNSFTIPERFKEKWTAFLDKIGYEET